MASTQLVSRSEPTSMEEDTGNHRDAREQRLRGCCCWVAAVSASDAAGRPRRGEVNGIEGRRPAYIGAGGGGWLCGGGRWEAAGRPLLRRAACGVRLPYL
jgi:hypothetical protein